MGDLREPSAAVVEERPIPSPSLSSPSNSSSSLIGAERWAIAEEATKKILCQVQPTAESEERRKEVIDYVQRLIRESLGCEIFPFGSVPLKTYLPDGDIDLTSFGGANIEDLLANDVVTVLESEEQNSAAEFVVKDVQLIRAEVKLVKCIVQNIVVDISFNQLGGLCTLCFLEEVDRLIGKDHLFKRSIILIKAWCYYESRILGAHHGLISTYALETLVLYIFHLFHSTLNGPLAVLYKFLDYFSKFDWENYCISLNGPVPISLLPEIVAETPDTNGGDLLLSSDFLRYCVDMFSVPSRGVDINSRTFPQKHLNIVDPLKENNNLGRSVSKGNSYRIRSAFTYGARKLGRILLLPDDNIADELCKFFSNTLDRHGSGQRPDVQNLFPLSSPYGFSPALPFQETESCEEEKIISELKSGILTCTTEELNLLPDQSFHNGVNSNKESGVEVKVSRSVNGHVNGLCSGSVKVGNKIIYPENDGFTGTPNLGHRCSGDAKDLATSRIQGLKISNGSPKRMSPPTGGESASPLGGALYAPHHHFSGSNGKLRHGNSDLKELNSPGSTAKKVSSEYPQVPDEGRGTIAGHGHDESRLIGKNEVLTSVKPKYVPSLSVSVDCSSEDLCPGHSERNSAGPAGKPDSLNILTDLRGDYDSHCKSLQYGRICFEHAGGPAFPMPSPLPSQVQSNKSWDMWHWSQFNRNGFSLTEPTGVIPAPVIYPGNRFVVPGAVFGMGEMPKPRGTGTYFPNTNRPPYQKSSSARDKSQAPARSPRTNGRALVSTEANLLERRSHELLQAQIPFDHDGGNTGFLNVPQSGSPSVDVISNSNAVGLQTEGLVHYETGQVSSAAPLKGSIRQLNSASSPSLSFSQSLATRGIQRTKPVLDMNQNRVSMQSAYHLKDEEDFPPLSI